MENIIIYGAGGLAKETVELIEDINAVEPVWCIKGYIDDIRGDRGETLHGYSILGNHEILRDLVNPVYIVLAISDPEVKKNIYEIVRNYGIRFATLIHPSAKVARSAKIGEGSIIGIRCIVSADVTIGNHVFLNMGTIIGHDAAVGDFTSCLVNTVISGNVTIDKGVLLGSGCVIMEKKTIGAGARISMGSIVSFDVSDGSVVMTRPSKVMKF